MTDLVVSPGTRCLTCGSDQPPGVPVVLVGSTGDTCWWACTTCAAHIEKELSR